MRIFIKRGSAVKEIPWRKNPLDASYGKSVIVLSRNITEALKVTSDRNIVQLLMIIAQFSIEISFKVYYRAFITEGRYIEIDCFSRLNKKEKRINIIQIDGETESPKSLKETIVTAAIASLKKMEIGERNRNHLLSLLEEKLEQVRENARTEKQLK